MNIREIYKAYRQYMESEAKNPRPLVKAGMTTGEKVGRITGAVAPFVAAYKAAPLISNGIIYEISRLAHEAGQLNLDAFVQDGVIAVAALYALHSLGGFKIPEKLANTGGRIGWSLGFLAGAGLGKAKDSIESHLTE